MKSQSLPFNNILEHIYSLSLEDKLEVKNLLEFSIANDRRNEIYSNYKKSKDEEKSNNLIFASKIKDFKKML